MVRLRDFIYLFPLNKEPSTGKKEVSLFVLTFWTDRQEIFSLYCLQIFSSKSLRGDMHCTKKQQPIVHPFQPFPPSTKQYQIRYHFFLKAKEGASKKVEQKLFLPYFLLGRVNDEDCRRKREECRHSCNYLSSASFTQQAGCTKNSEILRWSTGE